jgi:hypothetical protein
MCVPTHLLLSHVAICCPGLHAWTVLYGSVRGASQGPVLDSSELNRRLLQCQCLVPGRHGNLCNGRLADNSNYRTGTRLAIYRAIPTHYTVNQLCLLFRKDLRLPRVLPQDTIGYIT